MQIANGEERRCNWRCVRRWLLVEGNARAQPTTGAMRGYFPEDVLAGQRQRTREEEGWAKGRKGRYFLFFLRYCAAYGCATCASVTSIQAVYLLRLHMPPTIVFPDIRFLLVVYEFTHITHRDLCTMAPIHNSMELLLLLPFFYILVLGVFHHHHRNCICS